MAERTPTIGGNWKMNLHREDATALASALADRAGDFGGVKVTVFPAFPYLASVAEALAPAKGAIKLGAQDGDVAVG